MYVKHRELQLASESMITQDVGDCHGFTQRLLPLETTSQSCIPCPQRVVLTNYPSWPRKISILSCLHPWVPAGSCVSVRTLSGTNERIPTPSCLHKTKSFGPKGAFHLQAWLDPGTQLCHQDTNLLHLFWPYFSSVGFVLNLHSSYVAATSSIAPGLNPTSWATPAKRVNFYPVTPTKALGLMTIDLLASHAVLLLLSHFSRVRLCVTP